MQELEQAPRPILTSDQRIRIFVSSTIGELHEERKTVQTAIKNLKLHPILFEDAARPHPPREMYKANLEQSHIYLGIFWKSYGWIAPEMDISGIEDEYNLSADKPRLVYIKEASEGRDPKLEQLLKRIEKEGSLCYKTFTTAEELAELIQNDIMLLLSEHFGLATQTQQDKFVLPDYLTDLKSEIQERGYIQRLDLSSKIKNKIENNNSLVIYGNPGIGKTFLLGQLGTQIDAIYISLRNKTSQQVCSYLANRLALNRGQVLRNLPSEDEARFALQQELSSGTSTLLIDDCDQNQAVVESILSLDFYNNKAVYVTRAIDPKLYQKTAKFEVPALNREEVSLFLSYYGISLPPGEFEGLLAASKSNPLYLFYFTQYQISPLPEGLQEYQHVLWQMQPPTHKELMNFLAFSFKDLNLEDFHALLNSKQTVTPTIMATKAALEESLPLIRYLSDGYEFFHPYFEEYVREIAKSDRLDRYYHIALGEYSLQKRWLVPTVFHLLRANDSRADEYLSDAIPAAMRQGEWQIAEEFSLHWIEVTKKDQDKNKEAFARYLLAQIYQELGRYSDAREQVNSSIRINDEIGNTEGKEFAEIWASTLLIELGEVETTIEILKKALDKYKDKDDYKESYVQVNLSFAYIQKSLFREGAEAAQRGLDLSKKLGIQHGIETSLINLAGCVGHLGDIHKQREYAEQIIGEARKRNLPRQIAAGLNQLAIVQRRSNEYIAAQQSLEEAISICRSLGNIEAELLNIGNLGNVFRDQNLYDKAENAYTEYLFKAREYGFTKHEARALELLSHIKYDKELYEEAIELGNEALALHKKFGEHLRIASTQDYLARSYLALDLKQKAAESYQNSAKNYAVTGLLDDPAYGYERAAGLWNVLNKPQQAAFCVAEGARCAILDSDPLRAHNVLTEVSEDQPGKYGDFFLQTLNLYLQQSKSTLTNFINNFSAYCKKHYDSKEKSYFKKGLDDIVAALEVNSSPVILNALAVAIEQADKSLLPISDFDDLVRRVTDVVKHIHYRLMPDGIMIFTVGLAWDNPIVVQIIGYSDEKITHRLAFTLALILIANQDLIQNVIKEFGENYENGFELNIALRDEMELGGIKIPIEDEEIPVNVSASNVDWGEQQPPTYLFLHENYERISDWATNPGNKALVALLMFFHKAIVCHCVHIRQDETHFSGEMARKAREFCEAILK